MMIENRDSPKVHKLGSGRVQHFGSALKSSAKKIQTKVKTRNFLGQNLGSNGHNVKTSAS